MALDSGRYMSYLFMGLVLIGIGVGSWFSIKIVQVQFFLLLLTFLIAIYYMNESLQAHFKGKAFRRHVTISGYVAMAFLSLFIGVQIRLGTFFILGFLVVGILMIGYSAYRTFGKYYQDQA